MIREDGVDDAIGVSFGHMTLSNACEQPYWSSDPLSGLWPHLHNSDSIIMHQHREREERAKGFDDDEEFVPGLLTPYPPTGRDAAPAVNGTRAVTSSSSPSPPGTSRDLRSRAILIKRPDDGTIVRPPARVSSSYSPTDAAHGRSSKAIRIVNPVDGTVIYSSLAEPGSKLGQRLSEGASWPD